MAIVGRAFKVTVKGRFAHEDSILEIFEIFELFFKKAFEIYSQKEWHCTVLLLSSRVGHEGFVCPQVGVMDNRENQLVMDRWNATAAPYCTGGTAPSLFEQVSRSVPNGVALTFEGELVSYGELEQRASLLAHRLSSFVHRDSVIGLCVVKSMEEVVGMVGIMRAGGGYVPLDPKQPAERLLYLVHQCMCVVVVGQQRFESVFNSEDGRCTLIVAETVDLVPTVPLSVMRQDSEQADLAYILFTSGSTGRPKGVMIQQKSLACFLAATCASLEFGSKHTGLYSFTFTFDPSVKVLWCLLCQGAQVCVIPPGALLSGTILCDLLRSHLVNYIDTTPAILKMILEANDWLIPAEFESICLGGSVCEPQMVARVMSARPDLQIVNTYGPTECTIASTEFFIRAATIDSLSSIPIGPPMAGSTCLVLAPNFNSVPIDIAGLLYLGGAKVAAGYVGRPDLTSKGFQAFDNCSYGRQYATGDRVRWLPSGELEFLGRLDFQIKLNGQRIEAGEIEAVLRQVEGVDDALVLLRGGGVDEAPAHLAGYIVSSSVTPIIAKAACNVKLPRYMVPSRIVALAAWPLSSTGKVDQTQLPAIESEVALEERQFTQTEQVLVCIWAHALHITAEYIGVNSDFFELGGTSLSAVTAVSVCRHLSVCSLQSSAVTAVHGSHGSGGDGPS